MKELTEKQISIIEIAAGIIFGLGEWVLLWLAGTATDDILKWAWVALFAVIVFGERGIEKKYQRPLRKFRWTLMISLIVGLAAFALLAFVFKVLPT